jgi:hypothetical protein
MDGGVNGWSVFDRPTEPGAPPERPTPCTKRSARRSTRSLHMMLQASFAMRGIAVPNNLRFALAWLIDRCQMRRRILNWLNASFSSEKLYRIGGKQQGPRGFLRSGSPVLGPIPPARTTTRIAVVIHVRIFASVAADESAPARWSKTSGFTWRRAWPRSPARTTCSPGATAATTRGLCQLAGADRQTPRHRPVRLSHRRA